VTKSGNKLRLDAKTQLLLLNRRWRAHAGIGTG